MEGESFDATRPLWSLTVKQFRSARSELCEKYREFFVDESHKTYKVKMVGKVVNNALRVTPSSFFGLLEDTTGELPFVVYTLDQKAVLYDARLPRGTTPLSPDALRVNTYYEFVGAFKFFEKARSEPPTQHHFEILFARRIDDFNAVTAHMLQCIHHHLLRTQGPPPQRAREDVFFEDDGMGEEDCE